MRFPTLAQWLAWQETLHPQQIELGLARIKDVDVRLSTAPLADRIVMVAGTNGKGSTVAFLEAIYLAAGYRVGCYTSPHVMHYNERIRLDGAPIDDAALCAAFERVDQARGETSLTYFEFGTLAAFELFRRQPLDIAILEVGLGGRLDAVNIAEPDVGVITTIALDHTQWLGETRAQIAREKLGIARPGKPLVIGELDMPVAAEETGAEVTCLQRDFEFRQEAGQWQWRNAKRQVPALPFPALRGQFQFHNASLALQVVDLLASRLPVSHHEMRRGIGSARLPGRLEAIAHGPLQIWLDVAHNPQSVQVLAEEIARWPPVSLAAHTRYGVFGAMADKDIATMLHPMLSHIDHWRLCELPTERAASAGVLQDTLLAQGVEAKRIGLCSSVAQAIAQIAASAPPNAQVIVFGSFYTVAAAKEFLEK